MQISKSKQGGHMNNTSEMLRMANQFLVISKNSQTYVPNFVNMAFACELYLKTILKHKTGSYQRGHDLEALYNQALQYINESDFLDLLAKKYDASFIGMVVTTSQADAKVKLQCTLCRHRNLFVDWRYIFEASPKSTPTSRSCVWGDDTISTKYTNCTLRLPDKYHAVDGMFGAFAQALNEYVNAFVAKST